MRSLTGFGRSTRIADFSKGVLMTNALKCAAGLALASSLALAAVLTKDIAAADHGDAPYASVKRSGTSATSSCSWIPTTIHVS